MYLAHLIMTTLRYMDGFYHDGLIHELRYFVEVNSKEVFLNEQLKMINWLTRFAITLNSGMPIYFL